jgi:hypothetical protein
MPLLLDFDYEILTDSGLKWEEDATNRFLVLKNFPLQPGLYVNGEQPLSAAEILIIIPSNYNTSGNDMFWTHPALLRADGKPIPAAFGFGQGDARSFEGKEYCRWSRHYDPNSWKPKGDNVQKIIDRVQWALTNPDASK